MLVSGGFVAEAGEYGGVVTGGGVAIPGATITATRDDKQIVITTDQTGAFRFAELEDGEWTIRVEMLGFASATKNVTIAPGLQPSTWLLPLKSVVDVVGSTGSTANDSRGAAGSNGSVSSNGSRSSTASPGADGSSQPNASNLANPPSPSNLSNPPDPFGTADGYLVNGSVNNGAASPFAQMAAFGNN